MADHSLMKLGKQPPRVDSRTLKLAKYLPAKLPPLQKSVWWTGTETNFGLMLNDSLGDCTIAGGGHQIQVWTMNAGSMVTVPDSDILGLYKKFDGYVEGDPGTDNGGVELDVLNKWHKSDFAGHKLFGYADPDPGNFDHIKQSIYLFGGVYIGLSLPATAATQDTWDVVDNVTDGSDAPYSWGGHCVCVPNYDNDGEILTCITWGGLKQMTKRFWETYCDESHTLFGADWLMAEGINPAGYAKEELLMDLLSIR